MKKLDLHDLILTYKGTVVQISDNLVRLILLESLGKALPMFRRLGKQSIQYLWFLPSLEVFHFFLRHYNPLHMLSKHEVKTKKYE